MEPTRILTTDEIAAVNDIDERAVQIPKWGGAVRLRTPTLRRIDILRKQATRYNPRTRQEEVEQDKFLSLIMVECVVEPKITLEIYEQWKDKSAAVVATLQKEVTSICGLSEAAVADADKSDGKKSASEVRV